MGYYSQCPDIKCSECGYISKVAMNHYNSCSQSAASKARAAAARQKMADEDRLAAKIAAELAKILGK